MRKAEYQSYHSAEGKAMRYSTYTENEKHQMCTDCCFYGEKPTPCFDVYKCAKDFAKVVKKWGDEGKN